MTPRNGSIPIESDRVTLKENHKNVNNEEEHREDPNNVNSATEPMDREYHSV